MVDTLRYFNELRQWSVIGSGDLPLFTQSGGSSPVPRTILDKLTDVANAADWGFSTSNTGSQNATALTNALASGARVINISGGVFALDPFAWAPPWTYAGGSAVGNALVIKGAGRETTVLRLPNGANSDFFVIGDETSNGAFTVLQDLTLDANGANQSSGSGLYFKNVGYTVIQRVRVLGAHDHGIIGFSPDYTFNGNQFLLLHCQVQDFPFSSNRRTGHGIYMNGACQASSIIGCDVSGGTLNSTTTWGLYLFGAANVAIVANNFFPDSAKIMLSGSSLSAIIGNNIISNDETTAVDGLTINAGSACTISGNTFAGINGKMLRIEGGTLAVAASGNVFLGSNPTLSASHAISEESGSDYNAFTGNSIFGTFSVAFVSHVGANSRGVANIQAADF